MRKFTADISADQFKAKDLNFVESTVPYLVNRALIEQDNDQQKKISLNKLQSSTFSYFIANQILYCERYQPIDLSAEKFTTDRKAILGCDIPFPFKFNEETDRFFCV